MAWGEEDPRAIMRRAEDPSVPAFDVLARARSRSGKLVQAAQQAIARRDTGAVDMLKQAPEAYDLGWFAYAISMHPLGDLRPTRATLISGGVQIRQIT